MSETVTIYLPRWTGVDNTLRIDAVEGERTARQIRVRSRNGHGYTVHDPEKANYSVDEALAVMQNAVDSQRTYAEWMLAEVAGKQAQIDQYRAGLLEESA